MRMGRIGRRVHGKSSKRMSSRKETGGTRKGVRGTLKSMATRATRRLDELVRK